MSDLRDKENKDQMLTIWVMKDRTAEPAQYRVNTRTLKLAASAIVALPLVLALLLVGTGIRCSYLGKENLVLSEIAERYQCSGDQLLTFENRLSGLEHELSQSCSRSQVLIEGMENELNRWLPENGVGGGEDDDSIVSDENSPESYPLSPSQLEQVNDLKRRLSRLDEKLDSYDRTIDEFGQTWDDRNSLYSALPTLWPVAEGRITSPFGMRVHPISRKYHMHDGVDIGAPSGTIVFASAAGLVVFSAPRGGYGKVVEIDHGYGFSTFYAHCRKLLVEPGQTVEKGQPIAKVGNTGFSTGPHLHFEVRMSGMPVDPMRYLNIFSTEEEE